MSFFIRVPPDLYKRLEGEFALALAAEISGFTADAPGAFGLNLVKGVFFT
jgi:hypothetical protein